MSLAGSFQHYKSKFAQVLKQAEEVFLFFFFFLLSASRRSEIINIIAENYSRLEDNGFLSIRWGRL